MPSEEYTAVSSGALRLKGVASDSKVKKKNKKKKKPQPESAAAEPDAAAEKDNPEISAASQNAESIKLDEPQPADEEVVGDERIQAMTEAERHYFEMRKKRLNERLRKEGTKTHKERVEDLNRYLNKLSEHHDMPKIGPG